MREKLRYFSVLDGCSISNEDVAGDPQYYGYTRPGGSWVIMRYNTALGTYAFFLGSDTPSPFAKSTLTAYDNAWTNRAIQQYSRTGEFRAL